MWIMATGWTKTSGASTRPKGGEKIKVAFNVEEASIVHWDDAASLRLSRIPYFLRAMVKKGVEKHAQENGITTVTDRAYGRTAEETLRQRRTGIQVLRLEV